MLRNLLARLHRLLHPPTADAGQVRERMTQFVGVEVEAVPYKIEPRPVQRMHGECHTTTSSSFSNN